MADLSRRRFLGGAALLGLAACTSGREGEAAPTTTTATTTTAATAARVPTTPPPRLSGPPFTLGVASGDPLADAVVLWTRLAPEPLAGGGMPPQDVVVEWEVAADERFARVVRQGSAVASPAEAHSVHVDVRGLEPAATYWYRFRVGAEVSPVGRTRTAPAAGASPERLRVALASCQNWQAGYWSAYRHMAEEDLDLVVHVGDYVYESAADPGALRRHDGPEPTDLAGYRNRHALYKTDPALRAVHAAFPWVTTWDDHETENNYAGATPEGGAASEAFLARRAAAYRAYWEHLPLRSPPPAGPHYRLHRSLAFGDLLHLVVLDTRQYRTPQPCGGSAAPRCPEALDPAATMTGADQERFLFDALDRSPTRWNLVAQQVVMMQTDVAPGPLFVANPDQWDGYVAARRRFTDFLGSRRPANPVVLSGDIHASLAGDLLANFDDPASPPVGAEVVCPGISSRFPERFLPIVAAAQGDNPHVRYFDGRRQGYALLDLDRRQLRADFRLVADARVDASPITTATSFVAEDDRPGLQPA